MEWMPRVIKIRKAIPEFLSYFLDKNALRIFSLPSSAILMHIVDDILAGIIFLYLSKSRDTTPKLPTTIGITMHSQSHIRPSSILNPLYFDIFSCSFWATFISFGQDISIMKHFLLALSLTTISGRLKTYGLSVDKGVSQMISTFFSTKTSCGLCVCHLAFVRTPKLLHMAWRLG